ncbi:hypothetical protein J8273_7648 [Carpediemonas membranifera]|uniref:Uncharacterized protein n=1 Tax=Carpediemonas membranifera TaxID=201153 RepID=A0A8J6ASJ9_9EUKA|nr:hypothetical protein J8273_7648 [Carpediemonas membranifera]|eukprot:KAG9391280.1 hypothetical protein J8273_7648 [Carpediemonas membranifera]
MPTTDEDFDATERVLEMAPVLLAHAKMLRNLRKEGNPVTLQQALNMTAACTPFDRYAVFVKDKAPSTYSVWMEHLLTLRISRTELDEAMFSLAVNGPVNCGDHAIQFTDTKLQYALEKVTLTSGDTGPDCLVKWIGFPKPTICPLDSSLKNFAKEVEAQCGPARSHTRAVSDPWSGKGRRLNE